MRNLKRVLSLALAAIMLMGMMVMGTGAANVSDFTDAEKITNLEAASVTTAIDIFSGYGDGSFGGENYVNRAEMATIICKILLGSKVNADIYKGLGTFQDLAGYEWAEGYINMCYGQGIVSGTGGNNYEPGRPVKTWEAALMLQRALGWWDQKDPQKSTISELSVSNKSKGLGLYGDLTLYADEYLTRNDVAEMVFNAITKCVPVEYNESFQLYRNAGSSSIFSGVVFNYFDTLAYQTFGLVYAVGDKDAFGRPVITWGYGKLDNSSSGNIDSDGNIKNTYGIGNLTKALVALPETPVLEYTTTVTGRTLYNDLGLTTATDLDLVVDGLTLDAGSAALKVNVARGDTNVKGIKAKTDFDGNGNADDYVTGNGVLTQVYKTGATTYKVVIVNTYVMEINSVTEATREKDAFVTVAERVNSKRTGYYPYQYFEATYTTEAFAKDDVVLVTVAIEDGGKAPNAPLGGAATNKYHIQSMQLADSLQGEMTRYTETNNTMAVEGVTYSFNPKAGQNANHFKANGGKVGDDVVVYLDNYGYAIDVRGVSSETQTNYALVLAVDEDNSDVFHNNRAWAKLLMMDGSVVPVPFTWNDNKVNAGEQWDYDNLKDTTYNVKGVAGAGNRTYIKHETKNTLYTNIQTLVTYSVNSSGVYTLYTLGNNGDNWAGLKTDTNRSIASDNDNAGKKLFMNNATVLIVANDKGKDKYDVYTGVRTMPKIAENNPADQTPGKHAFTMVAQEPNTSLVNVIYTEAGVKPTSSKDLIYIASKGEYVNDKNLGPYVNFTAVVNGELVDLKVEGTVDPQTGEVSTDKVVEGALYNAVTYNKDNIVTSAVLATEKVSDGDSNDYWRKTGLVAANKDVIGVGGNAASATYFTWSDDVMVAYIDVDGAGNIVATTPSITSLRTDANSTAIYGVANDNAGEITWLYVISQDAAIAQPIVTVGDTYEYTVGDLQTGAVIQVGDQTVVVPENSTTHAADVAAAVAQLRIPGYALSVTGSAAATKLVIKANDSSHDFTDINPVKTTAMTAATDDATPDAGKFKITEGTVSAAAKVEYNLTGMDFVTIGDLTFAITTNATSGDKELTCLTSDKTLTDTKITDWKVPTFTSGTSMLTVEKEAVGVTTLGTTAPITVSCGTAGAAITGTVPA